jgi:hypothetical protein
MNDDLSGECDLDGVQRRRLCEQVDARHDKRLELADA